MSLNIPDQRPTILPVTRRMPTISDAIGQLSDTLSGQQEAAQKQKLQDAQASYYGAQATSEAERTKREKAKMLIDQFHANTFKPLADAGEIDKANALLMQFVTNNPDVKQYVNQTVRESTNNDLAARNGAQFGATQTGLANTSNDPLARDYATKKTTGDFMPEHAFREQGARFQDSPTPPWATPIGQPQTSPTTPTPQLGKNETKIIRRSAGDLTTAAQDQTSATQLTMERERQAGEDRRAKAKATADAVDPVTAKSIVDGVITDPQSYFSLPIPDKKIFVNTMRRAPSKLTTAEIDRLNAARLGSQVLDDAKVIVDKWQKRGAPITGPVLGRFNEATAKWGDAGWFSGATTPNLPPEQQKEYQQDIGQLRDWLGTLPVMEAKALAGGRTAYQVIQMVTSVSPSLSKGKEMFAGSIKGLETRFGQIADHLDKKQWGGKPPTTTAEPTAQSGAVQKKTVSRADLERLSQKERKSVGQLMQEAQQEGIEVTP